MASERREVEAEFRGTKEPQALELSGKPDTRVGSDRSDRLAVLDVDKAEEVDRIEAVRRLRDLWVLNSSGRGAVEEEGAIRDIRGTGGVIEKFSMPKVEGYKGLNKLLLAL